MGAARPARELILEQRRGRRHSAAQRTEERWTVIGSWYGATALPASPLRTWTLHHGHCAERTTVSLWAAWVVRGQLGLWEMCVVGDVCWPVCCSTWLGLMVRAARAEIFSARCARSNQHQFATPPIFSPLEAPRFGSRPPPTPSGYSPWLGG